MTRKQVTIIVGMLLATAAALFVVWNRNPPAAAGDEEHAEHAERKQEGETEKNSESEEREASQESKPDGSAQPSGGKESREAEASEHEEHGESDTVKLTPEQIKASGIQLDKAQAAVIRTGQDFPGEVRSNADRTAQVTPRVAGVVDAVLVNLGQNVRKGQVLAVLSSPDLSDLRSEALAARERAAAARVMYQREKTLWEQKISAEQDLLQAQQALREAEIQQRNAEQKLSALGVQQSGNVKGNTSLSRYELRAPFDGTVVEKRLALGEAVKEDATVFVVSDLSTVWADVNVSPKDLDKVRVGLPAVVKAAGSQAVSNGKITYVGNLLGEQTRSAVARVTLANPGGSWRPGLFVTVSVLASQTQVPVSVRSAAIQMMDDKAVVFVAGSEGFKATPVKLGRTDGQTTEILGGLTAGQSYVAVNSFVLKADIGKSSVEDEH